jgi:hypothetical protein
MRVGEPAILLYLAAMALPVLRALPKGVTMYLELKHILFAMFVTAGCGSDRIFFLESSDSAGGTTTTETASDGGTGDA